MLFRHMFYCKHVERLLCNVWISNKDFHQYSLRSPKWLVTRQPSVAFRKPAGRPHALFFTQVRCCVRSATAHAQLCAEHPVLHDVWGDGAHLAHHGEQPENSEPLPHHMVDSVWISFPANFLVLPRPQISTTCSVITPAFWTTAWRTACWPTQSCSGSSPSSWQSASCLPTACRSVDFILNDRWKKTVAKDLLTFTWRLPFIVFITPNCFYLKSNCHFLQCHVRLPPHKISWSPWDWVLLLMTRTQPDRAKGRMVAVQSEC